MVLPVVEMRHYSLPPISQESFTKWYGKKIPNTEDTIVWCGKQLPCVAKTTAMRQKLKPKHVFIAKNKKDEFTHYVLSDSGSFTPLPKRLHAQVFPNVSLQSMQKTPNNRVKVKISNSKFCTLPILPDAFWNQKKKFIFSVKLLSKKWPIRELNVGCRNF